MGSVLPTNQLPPMPRTPATLLRCPSVKLRAEICIGMTRHRYCLNLNLNLNQKLKLYPGLNLNIGLDLDVDLDLRSPVFSCAPAREPQQSHSRTHGDSHAVGT